MNFDYVIVGAGFSGAVLAQRLASSMNKKVLILDKRDHLGGNSYDYYNDIGLLVHKYGPHYFRTNFKDVIDYLSEFTRWRPCKYRIKASIKGKLYTFPINRTTLNEFFNMNLKNDKEAEAFLDNKRIKIKNPKNSEEQILSVCGKEIYEAFFKPYTIKQWSMDPKDLDPSVTGRIPVRTNADDSYFNEKFQAMPKYGYHRIFEKMLRHPNIKIMLQTDYRKVKKLLKCDKLIYTGSIDEFFDYCYGRLPYRSLEFKNTIVKARYYQSVVQINYPQEYQFTRTVEIKHATGQRSGLTVITREYPKSSGRQYYPIPRWENEMLYNKYKTEADKLKNVYFIGRLGEYKYLNMDQVVYNALKLFKALKSR
jgi:UDP-galactopyranose mutase